MPTLRITNGFNRLTDAGLEVRAAQICDAMDNNPNFPDPQPGIADFSALLAEYLNALALAPGGGRLQVAIKNQKRSEVISMLHKWSTYVLFAAKGDRVIAMSSGFTTSKEYAPMAPLAKPENLRVKNGLNPGELKSKVMQVKGALGYMHQYSNDPELAETNWKSVTCSSSGALIINLQPGTKYYFRVAAIGAKKQLVYSDVVSRIAI